MGLSLGGVDENGGRGVCVCVRGRGWAGGVPGMGVGRGVRGVHGLPEGGGTGEAGGVVSHGERVHRESRVVNSSTSTTAVWPSGSTSTTWGLPRDACTPWARHTASQRSTGSEGVGDQGRGMRPPPPTRTRMNTNTHHHPHAQPNIIQTMKKTPNKRPHTRMNIYDTTSTRSPTPAPPPPTHTHTHTHTHPRAQAR